MYLNPYLTGAAPAQPQDDWRTVAPAIRRPTESGEWWAACCTALPGAGRPRLFAVRDGQQCLALAPLARPPGFLPRLESIGVRQLHEPMDFVYASTEALAALCEQLAGQPLAIDLPRVPADSPLVALLPRVFRRRGYVRVCAVTPYPRLDIEAGWAVPESRFNAGRRSDFRRALRHAEKRGPLHFDVIRPQPAELPALLAEAYATELRSWKAANGTALAIDPLRGDFYRCYFAACCARGTLRLARLRIGEALVAMQLAVEADNRLWLLKIGYDEAYAQSSPGTLLMLHVVRDAVQKGLRSIEFLGAVEPWTQLWTRDARACVRIRAYPAALPAAVALAADAAAWVGRRLRNRGNHGSH